MVNIMHDERPDPETLTVLVNNEIAFDFDRDITFEDEQLAFLDRMDADMEGGIKIYGELQVNPDAQQRATFVVMNLINGLQQSNDAAVSAACAYLVNRHPALIEVHAYDHEDTVKIELIEE